MFDSQPAPRGYRDTAVSASVAGLLPVRPTHPSAHASAASPTWVH